MNNKKAKHKRLAERERLETKKREACLDALMGKPKKPEKVIHIEFDSDLFNRQVNSAIKELDKMIADGNVVFNPGVNTQWFIDQLRKF